MIYYFSQFWQGSYLLGSAGLSWAHSHGCIQLVAGLGWDVLESLTHMPRVLVLVVLLHMTSHPSAGQTRLLHSMVVSGFQKMEVARPLRA